MTPGRAENEAGAGDGVAGPGGPAAPPACVPGPVRRTVRIINPLGLHHRVADRFARTAKGFVSAVTLWNGDTRADGTSLWDLLGLVALPGADVVLEVEGPDAAVAADALAAVLAAPGGEDYTI